MQIENRSCDTFKWTEDADIMDLRSLFSTAHQHELFIRRWSSKQKEYFYLNTSIYGTGMYLLYVAKEFFIVCSVVNQDFHITFPLSEEVHKSTLKPLSCKVYNLSQD